MGEKVENKRNAEEAFQMSTCISVINYTNRYRGQPGELLKVHIIATTQLNSIQSWVGYIIGDHFLNLE